MTLQERVLEALSDYTLSPKQLYAHLVNESAGAVDFAIRGLVKDGKIALVDGYYRRTGPASERVLAEGDNVLTVTHVKGGTVMGGVIVPADSQYTTPAAAAAPLRKCRRCQTPKPITDFPLKSTQGTSRLQTCQACWDYEAERALKLKTAKMPASLPGVAELVQRAMVRKPTFSPDLVCRLIEKQSAAAKALQVACDEVQVRRQELADIEELVRIATSRERGG
jgi:hypothetical protein